MSRPWRKKENPGARAGAHRVHVTKLVSENDYRIDSGMVLEHQVRRVLNSYAVSFPLAIVIAELAFYSERPS